MTLLEGVTKKALKTRIEKTRLAKQNAVLQAYSQRRDAARSEMLAAESREGQMRTAYEQQKREAMKFNANAATWTDLRGQIEGKRTLLDQLTKRLNETEVTSRLRGTNSSNIYWVDHADVGRRMPDQEAIVVAPEEAERRVGAAEAADQVLRAGTARSHDEEPWGRQAAGRIVLNNLFGKKCDAIVIERKRRWLF